jgi:restriction system protein
MALFWLLVAGVVIFLAMGILVEVFKILDAIVNNISNILKKISFINLLGRKSRGADVQVDIRLRNDVINATREGEIRSLIIYSPGKPYRNNYIKHSYVNEFQKLEARQYHKINSITLEQIKSTLTPNSTSTKNFIIELLNQDKEFSITKPLLISKLAQIPSVRLGAKFDIKKPTIKLPLYKSSKWMNGFVVLAFKKDIDFVKESINKQEELLELYNEQELRLKHEFSIAKGKYDAAVYEEKENYENSINEWNLNKTEWNLAKNEERIKLKQYLACFENNAIETQSKIILSNLNSLDWLPNNFEVKYDAETKILIVEQEFIDIGSLKFLKKIQLKSGFAYKPLNQKELKEATSYLYPSIALRLIHELAIQLEGDVEAIVINGWANYVVKATGNVKRAYCCSLLGKVNEIKELNLIALDALSAFDNLKGVVARSFEVTPIAPTLKINVNDKRFVDEKEILGKLHNELNLAVMDWEDFEHLCRQLFEKQFASVGAIVKVTQASRDQGVDAIVFDPDPVRGGKIVIQAKRYVNTVDVSAVRDLYGTVMNEGAMKGILVTTSQYGPEAYAFIKDKPLTLINGNELLGLLEQNGYKFRINLDEARKYLNETNSFSFRRSK